MKNAIVLITFLLAFAGYLFFTAPPARADVKNSLQTTNVAKFPRSGEYPISGIIKLLASDQNGNHVPESMIIYFGNITVQKEVVELMVKISRQQSKLWDKYKNLKAGERMYLKIGEDGKIYSMRWLGGPHA